MTLAAILAFVICFVLGPSLCWQIMRLPQKGPVLLALAALGIATLLAGLRLQAAALGLAALGLMWLAWVLTVSILALALMRRFPEPARKRWITTAALLATTLPWFGLATAEMMV